MERSLKALKDKLKAAKYLVYQLETKHETMQKLAIEREKTTEALKKSGACAGS